LCIDSFNGGSSLALPLPFVPSLSASATIFMQSKVFWYAPVSGCSHHHSMCLASGCVAVSKGFQQMAAAGRHGKGGMSGCFVLCRLQRASWQGLP
jgi:hypothetical protein